MARSGEAAHRANGPAGYEMSTARHANQGVNREREIATNRTNELEPINSRANQELLSSVQRRWNY